MQRGAATIDIFLRPGQHVLGDARHRIHTLLGSCVSITLWHRARRIGAMSHFLLAQRQTRFIGEQASGRYGVEALELMLLELQQAKLAFIECEAKIFGGGNMFPVQTSSAAVQVGQRNGEMARALLQACGIPIVAEHLYGIGHRQVIFDVASGHVWVRQVKPRELP